MPNIKRDGEMRRASETEREGRKQQRFLRLCLSVALLLLDIIRVRFVTVFLSRMRLCWAISRIQRGKGGEEEKQLKRQIHIHIFHTHMSMCFSLIDVMCVCTLHVESL